MNFVVIIAWIAVSVAVGMLADRKGRSFELFINISLVFSPLVGIIALLFVRPTQKALVESGRIAPCRYCGALIPRRLSQCTACGEVLPTRIRTDRESTIWVMLGSWTVVVLLGFGLLTAFGLAIQWARRLSL